MTFLANSNLILQISHDKTFKTRYTRCQYNVDKYTFMCGSNFNETDVSKWKNGLCKKVTKSQVVTESRLHCINKA